MEAGDIVFVRSQTLIGWIIRTFTKSNINHVAIAITSDTLIEALPTGVKITNISSYKDTYYEVYRFDLSPVWREQFLLEALKLLDRPYDWSHIGTIGLRIISGNRLRGDWSSKKRSICSEVVYEAAEKANLPTPPQAKVMFTPADCAKWPLLKRVQ